jgi:hypothetical protein
MADLKTLRVCLSKELPDRLGKKSNYIYFAYDSLELYIGNVIYGNNYAIVDSKPDEPATGILYILTSDGSVNVVDNLEFIKIAEIESPEQLDLLIKAADTFFVDGKNRYMDKRTRTLNLPYLNGSYQLSLNLPDNIKIDKNTVIRFNQDTEQFEIAGERDYYGNFTNELIGGATKSAIVNVDNHRITAEARVSNANNNIIKVTQNGLYASVADKVDSTEFNKWMKDMQDYRGYVNDLLDAVQAEIVSVENLVSESSIESRIHNQLQSQFALIEQALSNYDRYAAKIDELQSSRFEYASNEVTAARLDLQEMIRQFAENPWDDFNNNNPNPGTDPDTPDPGTDPVNPPTSELTEEEVNVLSTAALAAFIADTTN